MPNFIEPDLKKGMGYTYGKLCIGLVILNNQEERVDLDTGEEFTCVGKNYYSQKLVPDWESQLIPIQEVKLSSASEIIKPLGIIELQLIFQHPSQCIRMKVESLSMENYTSSHLILGNDYLSSYGIDISSQKYRYFTIGDDKRKKIGFLINRKPITVRKQQETNPEKHLFIAQQLKEIELNSDIRRKNERKAD
ncbi:hypothetical protein O181_000400 [Austropuccinia psidii MF-1]|uniref:Uncharacterized protein n=1 Tax=Austropuccinia psidii MF-1 TaxID=1389203 RepID=A0A9Q3B8V1_9BASI|nr:hypothetical protein [Austropuccinia psidii MF-1]